MDSNNYYNNTNGQYDANAYVAPEMSAPTANPNNGMAIGSLICGIVGILSCCCCGGGTIFGIVGIILAIVSRGKNGGKMSGLAIAGLICSILSIIAGIVGLIYIFAVGGAEAFMEGFNEGYNSTYYNY